MPSKPSFTPAPPERPAPDRLRQVNEALMLGSVRQHELAAASGRLNERLQTEIEQRIRAQAELQQADRRKDEFLAMLAHELRGPLAPLANALEIIQLTDGSGGTARKATATAARQLRHLVRLVDDLLDASRISRGKLILRRRRVELAPVLQQAVEAARPAIAAGEHQFSVTLPQRPVWLRADAVRLAQILGNLLTNACKYTEPHGRISLTARHDGKHVVIAVKDTGIGIAPDMLPHVFELFAQAEQGLARSQGGLGIGLSLVQRLVKMHGGTVTAYSAGLGHGSEFVLRLPTLPAAKRTGRSAAPPAPAVQPSRIPVSELARARRVLVVDDNRDSATTLALMLKLRGHDTRTAYDGEAAVAAAEAFRPEVVLLDIGLPKITGYEVARCMRQRPWAQDLVLIAVTGWGQDQDRRKSSEAGFDAHVVKPVDYALLEKLLAGAAHVH